MLDRGRIGCGIEGEWKEACVLGSCWVGVYSFKWLARGIKASPESVGPWLKSSKAQNTLIGNTKDSLGPCKSSPIVFETSERSNPCIGLCS